MAYRVPGKMTIDRSMFEIDQTNYFGDDESESDSDCEIVLESLYPTLSDKCTIESYPELKNISRPSDLKGACQRLQHSIQSIEESCNQEDSDVSLDLDDLDDEDVLIQSYIKLDNSRNRSSYMTGERNHSFMSRSVFHLAIPEEEDPESLRASIPKTENRPDLIHISPTVSTTTAVETNDPPIEQVSDAVLTVLEDLKVRNVKADSKTIKAIPRNQPYLLQHNILQEEVGCGLSHTKPTSLKSAANSTQGLVFHNVWDESNPGVNLISPNVINSQKTTIDLFNSQFRDDIRPRSLKDACKRAQTSQIMQLEPIRSTKGPQQCFQLTGRDEIFHRWLELPIQKAKSTKFS